jgi:hypothetical protein
MGLSKRILAVVVFTVFFAAGLRAGTLHGTVKNGTSGKTAAGIQVILIQLQGGMQPVANAQSDEHGAFTFDNPGIGAQPMLVRAVYHGINFHQPVPPGKTAVEVQIFETSRDAKTINVPMHVVIFQPNGSNLIVGEEYSIENHSNPPQAYFKTDGNFEFALPENAKLQNISAAGPPGMPVVQAPIDKTNNHFSIAYAFRPGQNIVRYSYELPYAGNNASVKIPTVYPGGRLLVVAPPTVQIAAEGLQPNGQEQGMNLYGLSDTPARSTVAISVSGTAPPPDDNAPQQGRDGQQGGGEASGLNIQQVPGRLDQLKWPIVGGFVLLFGVCAFLLARKPVVVTTTASSLDDEALVLAKSSGPKKEAAVAAASATVASMADVDTAVGNSLDALKEKIFRLELRRQAGTISEEEYTQERSRVETLLRELVRG